MADFFGDIFDAVTGQQAAPQQTIIPTNELMGQSFGMLGSTVAPGILGFNQALAPGLVDVQLGVANQLDPSILANFRGANKSILDQLALGGNLGEELQNQVITNALEGNAATGFGVGVGGRGLVARDLGLTSMDLLRRRQQDALASGTSGMGVSKGLYDPLAYSQVGLGAASGIAANIQQVQAAQDEAANIAEDVRRQNFSSLLNTGGRIAGTVAGGIFGGPGGAVMGGNIGGSLIQGSRVGGRGQGGASSPQFSSILSGLFSGMGGSGSGGGSAIGGPQYGIGGASFNNSSLGGGSGYDASIGF